MLFQPLKSTPVPLSSVFTFNAGSLPVSPLSFSKTRRQGCSRARKRTRPLSDIDDLPSASKKKRRLRLLLITSRLSRPFSTPATHIVDRGISKIAVWAKQKHLVPQALRKAAIMNRIRRRALDREAWLRKDSGISVGEGDREEARRVVMEEMKIEVPIVFGRHAPIIRRIPEPRHSVALSPLGLSNYDALDDEDGFYDDDECDEGSSPTYAPQKDTPMDDGGAYGYYSDFNFFDSSHSTHKEEDDEYDDPFSLSVIPPEITQDKRPPSPPEDGIIELMKEKERQREMLFLKFG